MASFSHHGVRTTAYAYGSSNCCHSAFSPIADLAFPLCLAAMRTSTHLQPGPAESFNTCCRIVSIMARCAIKIAILKASVKRLSTLNSLMRSSGFLQRNPLARRAAYQTARTPTCSPRSCLTMRAPGSAQRRRAIMACGIATMSLPPQMQHPMRPTVAVASPPSDWKHLLHNCSGRLSSTKPRSRSGPNDSERLI